MYCPGGRQGNNQQNVDTKYPPFAGHFDGRGDVPVLYCTHHLMDEVYGFHKATKRRHQTNIRSNIPQSDMPTQILGVYFIVKSTKKGSSWHLGPD